MNFLDIAIVVVLLLSGLFALMRGFVHEVLSVTAWLGAALATLYGLPLARPLARQHIETGWMADAAAGGAIFLVTLVVLSVLTHMVARRVRSSALNSLDRSLGFVFGLLRGAVLVCLAYVLAMWLIEPDEPPTWMTAAKTRPLVEAGARMLQSALPAEYGRAEAATKGTAGDAKRLGEAGKAFYDLQRPSIGKPTTPTTPATPSYDERDQQQMNNLFQSNK